jgi:hypothetical protein
MNESKSINELPPNAPPSRIVWFLFGAVPAFVAGILYGNLDPYYNRCQDESVFAERAIASSTDFKHLHVQCSSTGEAGLAGWVPNQDSYDKLKAAVKEQFGEMLFEQRMRSVWLENDVEPKR